MEVVEVKIDLFDRLYSYHHNYYDCHHYHHIHKQYYQHEHYADNDDDHDVYQY